jgi:hypothetical protein
MLSKKDSKISISERERIRNSEWQDKTNKIGHLPARQSETSIVETQCHSQRNDWRTARNDGSASTPA